MTSQENTPEANIASPGTSDSENYELAMNELQNIRRSIDNLDAALVHILAERFRATQRVGHLKAEHQLPAGDPAREEQQIKRLRSLAVAAQLDPEFAEAFLNFIISEVIQHHEKIAQEVQQ